MILVVTRRESAPFVDVLRDWSACGLVSELLVVDVEAPKSERGSWCRVIQDGTVRSSPLAADLAARPAISHVQVVCLSQVDEEFSTVGSTQGAAVWREVQDALPSLEVTWVHAIAVARPAEWPVVAPEEVEWVGCNNVVLAPEDSRSPGGAVDQISAGPLTPTRLTHQAAALCSAVGLWRAERTSLFTGAPAAGSQLIALRTFTRHLDASAVTSLLVRRAIDVSEKYPTPTVDGRTAQRFDDEAGAATRMAGRLFDEHATILAGTRVMPAESPQPPIGFLRLARLFLQFFMKALRRAPHDFVESIVQRSSERVAAAAQVTFLGREGSGFVVTVNGIRGIKKDGAIATAEEFDSEISSLLAQVQGHSGAVPAEQHDYSQFWKDFLNGGLTLLDAGRRSNGLDAERVGAGEGVVTSPRKVVVPADEVFEIAAELRTVVKVDKVSPHDADGARRAFELLSEEQSRQQSDRRASAAAAQAELREWFDERKLSYAGRVGERLSAELATVRKEIRGYVQSLEGMSRQTGVPASLTTMQRSLALLLLVHAAVFGAAACLVVLAVVFDWLSLRFGGTLVGVLAITWLISAIVIFGYRQRDLFKLRHQMESGADNAIALKENLAVALADLRRLQRVYRQYLNWASALDTFIQAPWGFTTDSGESQLVMGEGFPHNHRFGVATPDAEAIDGIIGRLRPRLFPVGWMSTAWTAFLADLPPLGSVRHLLEENPELIFSDRAVASTSVLSEWSRAIAERRWYGGAQTMEAELEAALGADSGLRDRLLSQVRSLAGDGALRVEPYQEFADGLQDEKTGSVEGRRFSQSFFARVPQTTDPWLAAALISNHDGSAIPDSLVVTETSRGFVARDLVFCGETAGGPLPPSTDPDAPIQSPPQV